MKLNVLLDLEELEQPFNRFTSKRNIDLMFKKDIQYLYIVIRYKEFLFYIKINDILYDHLRSLLSPFVISNESLNTVEIQVGNFFDYNKAEYIVIGVIL